MILLGTITPHSWGATECCQNIRRIVEPVVEITTLPSQSGGVITSGNGLLAPTSVKFSLMTNSDDNDYDFVLQASVKTSGNGNVNAYFENNSSGYIVLANALNKPSLQSVENIKNLSSRASDNPNAIAYLLSTTGSGRDGVSLKTSGNYGGYYYEINKGDNQLFTVSQTASGLPLRNTYSFESDRAGVYEATITFSAYKRP